MSARLCKKLVLSFIAAGIATAGIASGWALAYEPATKLLKKTSIEIPLLKTASLEVSRSLQTQTERAAQVESDRRPYQVWNIVFSEAADCQKFHVDGTSVITRFERFADVFVPFDE